MMGHLSRLNDDSWNKFEFSIVFKLLVMALINSWFCCLSKRKRVLELLCFPLRPNISGANTWWYIIRMMLYSHMAPNLPNVDIISHTPSQLMGLTPVHPHSSILVSHYDALNPYFKINIKMKKNEKIKHAHLHMYIIFNSDM